MSGQFMLGVAVGAIITLVGCFLAVLYIDREIKEGREGGK